MASAGPNFKLNQEQPGGAGMPSVVSLLALAVAGVAGLTLVLARLIPDEYDLEKAPARRDRP